MFVFDFPRVLFRVALVLLLAAPGAGAAEIGKKKTSRPAVAPASDEGELAIQKFKVPDGFSVDLFAAEPQLANPVCFTIDDQGRFYVSETFRHTDGVLDIRRYMNWLEEELASQDMDDHRATIRRHLSETPNMTRESERVRLIEDRDGDGKADFDSVFATDFSSELHGIGAGLLARQGDVYFTCIPNLYLLRDKNNDGKADVRKVLQTGYAVRFGFLGHDLHGLEIGPDGKLYFSIGDRGFSVKQGDRRLAFPEGGAVLRCNLDGSDLEIFSYGLRNPQELAFDDYGNLWTGENNSDGGDQARWAYLLEGGDTGWRIGYQFITHPNPRGPWNSEKMWRPANEDQPAYIIPPIANFGNGPSGLTYYPGVGLPAEYDGHFFLCDFKGTSARSLIHTFSVKPKGASFELVNRRDFMTGVLCTDVDFGPDSNLYVSDWTEGWSKPGKGRLYRVANPEAQNDPLVAETKRLLAEGFAKRSTKDLAQLLEHRDRRVRQEAQFELADRGSRSIKTLASVAEKNTNQLARIHAIWSLGQVGASKSERSRTRNAALNSVVPLLADSDPEIRAQAAKVLGEGRHAAAVPHLVKLLENVNEPRGQAFAAMALGKIRDKSAVRPILEMLRANNDQDPFLRHAGVMGILWIGDYDAIRSAARDESPAVRMGALLAMRRLQHPDIAMFLDDRHQKLVVEAARAINDLPIIQALPQLAGLIERPNYDPSLFRRVLNANFRVGEPSNAEALVQFVSRTDAPEALRGEALELLADWAKPSNLDRITGLYRRLQPRDAGIVLTAFRPRLAELLKTAPNEVKLGAIRFADRFAITEVSPLIFDLLAQEKLEVKLRIAALQALANHNDPRLFDALEIASQAKEEKLRKEALSLQAKLKPADATAALVKALENGSVGEQQNALAALGKLEDKAADKVLSKWMDKLIAGSVPSELHLDLVEAAAQREAKPIKRKLATYNANRADDPVAIFREALAGGNADEGRKIFFEKVEASCVRCHKIKGEGGDAGPVLDGIGSRATREYLLASLVAPNRDIAPGFESITLHLTNGTSIMGTLKSETKDEVVLESLEDGTTTVKVSDIARRDKGVSGMPAELSSLLTKQELRNLVEFLANQK